MDEITLREYLLNGYEGDESNLFFTDEEMIEAESWDANVFVKRVFDKDLGMVRKSEVYRAFRQMVKQDTFLYDLDPNASNVEGNNLLLENGSKKLNLVYNENFELVNFDVEF